jgi:UDP-2,3-diacylglucosamine pyrophosphatase LpxH
LLGNPTAHIFIPDTHIVPRDDIEYWPGCVLTPSRVELMTALLDTLARLRAADPSLMVWQLGDFIDLWRTGKEAGMSFDERMRRLMKDWKPVLDRFAPDGDLSIRRVCGNHDEDLQSGPAIKENYFVPADPGDNASNDMLVTHGNCFDPIEILPGWLKEAFMRGFTERVTPYAQDMITATNPNWMPQADYTFTPPAPPKAGDRSRFLAADLDPTDRVPLGTDRWNVDEVRLVYDPDANPLNLATGPSNWQDDHSPKLWDCAKHRALEAAYAGYAVSLVVVGHTHDPRIVIGQHPDGRPIVLMDCGGWVGPAFISPGLSGVIHKCTIGVRVGGDLRVYQLGHDAYDWPQ